MICHLIIYSYLYIYLYVMIYMQITGQRNLENSSFQMNKKIMILSLIANPRQGENVLLIMKIYYKQASCQSRENDALSSRVEPI